jgi:hypothetical protein
MSYREEATTLCGCLHTRPLACLPQEKGACLGTIAKGTPQWGKIASEARIYIYMYQYTYINVIHRCQGHPQWGKIASRQQYILYKCTYINLIHH